MMIKMVDSDGDGQVSFTEFYNVVTDPDPAHTDFVKMAAQEEEDPAQSGDPGQMDAKAHERHKEITLRNKKREMMEAFTVFVLCGTSSRPSIRGVSACGGGDSRATRSCVSLGDRVRVWAENMAAVPRSRDANNSQS